MANRYWVGGTATWDTTAGTKWATSTGGSGGASVPTAADDVFFDGSSGSGTVTVAADTTSVNCRSLNFTGFIGTFSHPANSTVNIGDGTAGASNIALLMSASMTYSVVNGANSVILFKSTSTTQQTIQCKSGAIMGAITIDGVGSNYILSANGFSQTASGVFTITRGTFNTGNFNCTIGFFWSSNSNTRTIALGSSTISLLGLGTTFATAAWDTNTVTGLTFNANTSTISFNGTAAQRMNNGNRTYNNVTINSPGVFIFAGSGTYANITRTGTAVKQDGIDFAGNPTITGTLTLNGNSAVNRLLVTNDISYIQQTLTAANVSCSNVDFRGIKAAGAGNWDLSAITGNSGDGGYNSGITFTPAVTQTATGTASFTWSTHSWTTRVPLPQDDVIVNNAFTSGRTVTCDMVYAGNNIDISGATGSPTFTGTIATKGNVILPNNGTFTSLAITLRCYENITQTLTTNGRTTGAISTSGIHQPSNQIGTITLGDNLTSNSSLTISTGTNFTSANKTISVTSLQFGSTTIYRKIDLGTSTVNLNTTAANGNIVDLSSTAGYLTCNISNTIINITSTTANTRNVVGNGQSFGTLNYTVAGSTGTLVISGNNTFKQLNFSDATNARTLQFTAGSNNTITESANIRGTAGKLITITSSTAATHTITDSSNSIDLDYVNVSYSIGVGANGLYAGDNSVDGGNNTNWFFKKRPTGNFLAFMDYV